MTPEARADLFEEARPQLVGVAYRLLGSLSEAEDVVQDTALKWLAVEPPLPDRPAAWMTTVCTNRCLDILKSSQLRRTDYVGPWIPDSLATETAASAEQTLEMASSLTTAFLLLMERLSPRERAAYLLHDIFDMDFNLVSESLNLSPANCRQLASRARKMIASENARFVPDETRQQELLESFQAALETGSTEHLAKILSEDVDLRADSGGKVRAIHRVLTGPAVVSDFVARILGRAWSGLEFELENANGQLALVVRENRELSSIVTFGYGPGGDVRSIFIQRNPDKLAAFSRGPAKITANGGLAYN